MRGTSFQRKRLNVNKKKKDKNCKIQFPMEYRYFRGSAAGIGLPKVIGQGIYKRENLLRVPEYAGGGESAERERTKERERVRVREAPVYVMRCSVLLLLLLRLFSGNERERERERGFNITI